MDTLVLGARGGLGTLISAELAARGHVIRTVPREAARDANALARAAAGCEAIVNCAGASVALGLGKGWRGYYAVDTRIGLAAIEAAKQVGSRLVYVAVAKSPALARCAYVDAHERVAAAMGDGVVVRATGFFSAYAALLPMARRGWLVDIGNGKTRTNPIAEYDLAEIVADAVTGDGPREISAGGPEVMTRAEIFEAVAAVAGRRVRMLRIPAWLGGAQAAMLRLVHPRMGQFAKFAALLAKHDCIADARGTATLRDYLEAEVGVRHELRANSSRSANVPANTSRSVGP
ncbi:MAG: hypothetical protein ABI867_39545 [Kofleriaceae bacterium]